MEGEEPNNLRNKLSVYSIKNEIKADFKKEVSSWMELGWLKEYSGEEKVLLPLMAVVQAKKRKSASSFRLQRTK